MLGALVKPQGNNSGNLTASLRKNLSSRISEVSLRLSQEELQGLDKLQDLKPRGLNALDAVQDTSGACTLAY